MNLSTLGRFALVLSVPSFLLACVVDTTSSPTLISSSGGSVPEYDAGTAEDGGGPSAHPILAMIDTGQTMTVSPGQGVGVFAEYDQGGLWHIWWSCGPQEGGGDPPCQFDVTASVASGTISSPASQGFLATDTFTSSATSLEGITTTTTAFDGFTFQTAPSAVLTLTASVGGVYDGRFLFFVEGGKVQDGAPWLVTDPVLLQGSTP